MITPTRFEIRCCAWDCDPDRYPYAPVMSKPLVVDARSVREAGQKARAAGWRPTGDRRPSHWHCPRHALAFCQLGHTRQPAGCTLPAMTRVINAAGRKPT